MRSERVAMRKLVAAFTAGFMLTTQVPFAQSPASKAWDIVRDLPPGTRLRLQLGTGGEVTGSVVSTTPDNVVMKDNVAGRIGVSLTGSNMVDGMLTIARADISSATVERAATQYRADGAPNPNAVRHVVTALGIGKKVRVQTRSGLDAKGTITAVNPDSFVLRRNSRSSETVPFADVNRLGKAGMRGWVKGAIIGGAVVGAVLVNLGVCYASGRCYS